MKHNSEKKYSIGSIFLDVIKVNPFHFILQYIFAITSSVLLGLFITQLQKVFDQAAILLQVPSAENGKAVLWALVLLFMYKYGSEGLEILNGYEGEAYYNRCAEYFLTLYNQKFGKISAQSFEDQENLELYNRALGGSTAGRGMLHVIMDVFAIYIPYFMTIAVYIVGQDASLLLIFGLIAVPVLVTNRMKKRIHTELHENAVKPKRQKEEYAKYLSDMTYTKEIRVNSLFPYFYEKYHRAREEYNQFYISSNRKKLTLNLATKVITLTGFLVILILLIQRLTTGMISIGVFSAIFYAVDEIYSLMEEVLVTRLEEYSENVPAMNAFIHMMNDTSIEREESKAEVMQDCITLEKVSFQYPNAEKAALSEISLSIHKNDQIAIVGYNGSGKSTLAKLLMGLYKPTQGSIRVDGVQVNSTNTNHVSVLFQNFNRYKETVLTNIQISERKAEKEFGTEREQAARQLKKVQLEFSEEMEDELDISCGVEFGGKDLSGGQWQKLATARMLYRNRDFVVLDEPTSAIDPVTEYQLFDLFEKELRNKTGIIITHRMASIKFCNRIIVLNNGKIEAAGDHDSLMQTSKLYQKLYHSIEECYE